MLLEHFAKMKTWNLSFTKAQTIACGTANCGQVLPVCFNYPWDVLKTCLDSNCGKLNWLNTVQKYTHLCISTSTIHTACVDAWRSYIRSGYWQVKKLNISHYLARSLLPLWFKCYSCMWGDCMIVVFSVVKYMLCTFKTSLNLMRYQFR